MNSSTGVQQYQMQDLRSLAISASNVVSPRKPFAEVNGHAVAFVHSRKIGTKLTRDWLLVDGEIVQVDARWKRDRMFYEVSTGSDLPDSSTFRKKLAAAMEVAA